MAKRFGFTLAEVLITMTIIGVVAALTIPNLLANINQRKYNIASANFQRKLGEALNIMSAQNILQDYDSTKDFVTELSRHMKIFKVCDNVTDCFPAQYKKSDGTMVETSKFTNAASLGRMYKTETVGVQFANGVRAILAYNPNYELQSTGGAVSFSKDEDNIVSMHSDVISMIFDVYDDKNNTLGEDIFQFNMVADVVKVGDYYVKDFAKNYTGIICNGTNTPFCSDKDPSWPNTDYWEGAKKKCQDEGMELPSLTDLQNISNFLKTDEYAESCSPSGFYWSTTDYSLGRGVYGIHFPNGNKDHSGQEGGKYGTLCIAN